MSKEKQIEEMARIICADSANKGLCEKCGFNKGCWKFKDAESIYNAGYRKQEWISVDERLPEHCGMPVLMVAVNSYDQTQIVKGFTDYQCPITFHTNEREYDRIWGAWDVTHWMPLPEAPKMKGE